MDTLVKADDKKPHTGRNNIYPKGQTENFVKDLDFAVQSEYSAFSWFYPLIQRGGFV